LEGELADVEKLRRRLAEQESALATERQALAKTLRRELEVFREETVQRISGEVERLRRELEGGRRRGLTHKAAERLFEEVPTFGADVEETPGKLVVGGNVRHRQLGWVGVLEKLDRGRAQVRTRGKSLRCRQEDLVASGSAPEAGATSVESKNVRRQRAIAAAQRGRVGNRQPEVESAPPELKLIGQRVEPALTTLDQFLDQALLASRAAVRIVHGHGSGRLRKAVRKHLQEHPAVASQRPGGDNEGGDGATVVELRGG
jgi:DNA mismatch repair protein MutS2